MSDKEFSVGLVHEKDLGDLGSGFVGLQYRYCRI